MDLQTSVYENQSDVSVVDNVLPLCELAKNLEEAGEFERAAEALQPFWKGLPNRPDTESLDAEAQAELLMRAGTLTGRSEEHTSELQSRLHLVCRLLLEKKKKKIKTQINK